MVSAIVANVYMDLFEELAAPSRPTSSGVDGLLNHLNSAWPPIKFTMELEEPQKKENHHFKKYSSFSDTVASTSNKLMYGDVLLVDISTSALYYHPCLLH